MQVVLRFKPSPHFRQMAEHEFHNSKQVVPHRQRRKRETETETERQREMYTDTIVVAILVSQVHAHLRPHAGLALGTAVPLAARAAEDFA